MCGIFAHYSSPISNTRRQIMRDNDMFEGVEKEAALDEQKARIFHSTDGNVVTSQMEGK